MARIVPITQQTATQEQKAVWAETEAVHGVVTNMKATLLHSPAALRAVLEWYALYDLVKLFLSQRETILFCNAISRANHCTLCSLFMRRAIVEWGEDPDNLVLDARTQTIVDFGRQLAVDANDVSDELFAKLKALFTDAQIVDLTTFGALMIVNNLFNSALKVDADASLAPYRVDPEILFCLSGAGRGAVTRNFNGKVALITGAAHGQGRAVAVALARAGAAVAGFDIARTLEYPGYALGASKDLESLREEIAAFGGRFLPLVGDVRDEAAVASAVSNTVAAFGGLDIVFGNAGVAAYGLVVELTEAQWDTVLDINLKGNFLLAKHATPHLVARGGGVIIFNSSVAGLRGFARLAHYSASKWGLVGLAKSLAIEVARHNVRVVTLHPTGVDTPLNDGLAELEGSTALEVAERSAGNLLPTPWVSVDDVVASVLFLASDDARFMTGSALVLDAGLLTR